MFLTARLFMYRQVYFHRTVRAIDLDLAEAFGTSIRALFGDRSPADALGAFADLDEYALLHQAALWARGEAVSLSARPGDGTISPALAATWRAILLRRPRWRSDAGSGGVRGRCVPDRAWRHRRRRAGPRGDDLATVDPPGGGDRDGLVAGRRGFDGRPAAPLSALRATGVLAVARRYRRARAPRSPRSGSKMTLPTATGTAEVLPGARPGGRAADRSEGFQRGYFVRPRTSGRSSNRSSRAC
jgi:hypothetical protein